MSSTFSTCVRVGLLLVLPLTCTFPLSKRATEPNITSPEIIKFMRRFGYLESNPIDSEALYHEGAISLAIKNLQKYGALNETGKIDAATIKLLSAPRCGVPDMKLTFPNGERSKRYAIGDEPWRKRRLTYHIANLSSKMEGKNIERDLEKVFEEWAKYSRLKFTRGNQWTSDIVIHFGSFYHGDSYPFDGAGNILAHSFYPYQMGSYGGDIHFDEDENWKENATNLADGVAFYTVALHELGHSIGLAHSPVYSSIMFAYYKGPAESTLHYDDIMAVYDLYVQRKLEDDVEDVEEVFPQTTPSPSNDVTEAHTGKETTTRETFYTYLGDYDTINGHKRKYATAVTSTRVIEGNTTTPPDVGSSKEIPTHSNKPIPIRHICNGHFDAVSTIGGAVYIFKGQHAWKLTQHYKIESGYPIHINEIFPFLPANVDYIDAAYERYDGTITVYKGKMYWIYDRRQPSEYHIHNITELISEEIPRVNAAMLWAKNNLTYIFAKTQFWRVDDRLQRVHEHYPKPMQRWVGIPNNIDAAATFPNGKTYFFKGSLYWLYNNTYIRPENGYPRRISTAWLRCPLAHRTKLRNFNTTVKFL